MERKPDISYDKILKMFVDWQDLPIDMISLVTKINEDYEFWDTVKYKKVPANFSTTDLWSAVVVDRMRAAVIVWEKYKIHFGLTNKMQRQCHEFDMSFGGSWASDSIIPTGDNERYLVSSLMEEAISSSQMEGAATTRKVAKDMLRKHIAPKDRSQRMIFNNYQTIQFIVANKNKSLTQELLLHIHRLMTENTLENSEDAGRFPQFIVDLCDFFNCDKAKLFIHPIIRGVIIHFMLAYMHPFVDGNGRTARALFYWYMLKQGYWLTEYLSISRIIYRSKQTYEKSFLYAEADNNDIGYFINYNLRALELSFKELQNYIKRKTEAKRTATTFLRIGNINERQAEIIKIYYQNPKEMLTVKDLEARFLITPTTAKSDIVGLLKIGALTEISLNKVKKGYIKGERFDTLIERTKL